MLARAPCCRAEARERCGVVVVPARSAARITGGVVAAANPLQNEPILQKTAVVGRRHEYVRAGYVGPGTLKHKIHGGHTHKHGG